MLDIRYPAILGSANNVKPDFYLYKIAASIQASMRTTSTKHNSKHHFILTCLLATFSLAIGAFFIFENSRFSLLNYPWLFPDSYDWLANGLRYSSAISVPYEISHRALLLPIVSALFFSTGLENILVNYGMIFHLLTVFLMFIQLRTITSSGTAWLAAIFYLISFNTLSQSLFVGSDIAANFFLTGTFLSFYNFLKDGNTRNFYLSLAFTCLGIHSQYIGIIVAPAAILSLFFKPDTNLGFKLSIDRLGRIFRVKSLAISAAIVLLLGLLPFLVRYETFGVFYTEGVQHGSLVRWHFEQPQYYVYGFLSSFGWPIVLLALLELGKTIKTPDKRHLGIFLLLWALNVFVFFSFLYTWKDVRLLIYSSTPVFTLAALYISELFKSKNKLSKLVAVFGFIFSIYGVTIPATFDPFDVSFILTPQKAAFYTADHSLEIRDTVSQPFIWEYYQISSKELSNRSLENIENTNISTDIKKLFKRLKNKTSTSKLPWIVYLPHIYPFEAYIIRNRNILYAKRAVGLSTGTQDLTDFLKELPAIIIAKHEDVEELKKITGSYSSRQLLKRQNNNYEAFLINK